MDRTLDDDTIDNPAANNDGQDVDMHAEQQNPVMGRQSLPVHPSDIPNPADEDDAVAGLVRLRGTSNYLGERHNYGVMAHALEGSPSVPGSPLQGNNGSVTEFLSIRTPSPSDHGDTNHNRGGGDLNMVREIMGMAASRNDVRDLLDDLRRDFRDFASDLVRRTTTAEVHMPPSGRTRARPFPRRTRAPVRRPEDSNQRSRDIRTHLAALSSNSRLLPAVTTDELRTFAHRWSDAVERGTTEETQCCTPVNFRIDLINGPHSPWNQSAARVFANDFIARYEIARTLDTLLNIQKHFYTCVKGLKAKLKRRSQTAEERRRERVRNASTGRKRSLFYRRLDTALDQSRFGTRLSRHVPMLEQLGPDGMSSDEGEGDDLDVEDQGGTQVFKIYEPRFRSTAVRVWLRTLDSIHSFTRRISDDKRGTWPRTRISQYDVEGNTRRSTRTRFVPGLPINAYDQDWLESRGDREFVVRPSNEEYDFTIDPQIMEYLAAEERNRRP
ncbi:hypothetical protein PLICRDRAFT_176778 [Plicaturopsis crispa FD-325 SS-3]|nr:hypothetical protein PLICRDRAFT_176778 [Plicaturopsis crispa FD-325 SS-3]